MNIHIALYKWKPEVRPEQINQALQEIEELAKKVPGILGVTTGKNTSKYSEGYTHVILVRGENQAAIDAYRNHPDHTKAAATIESMEDQGIGVDFSKDAPVEEKESQSQLSQRLAQAAQQVTVGARYMHYKQLSYKVLALALREEDNEPCVVYQAEYGDHITFTRPLTSWLEEVEVGSKKVERFTKL